MPTQCLASTGSNLLAVLGIGFVLAVIGFFLLRSAKGRAAVMVLVLVGGGLLVSQATAKPASAACVASSTTTMRRDIFPRKARMNENWRLWINHRRFKLDDVVCEGGARQSHHYLYNYSVPTIATVFPHFDDTPVFLIGSAAMAVPFWDALLLGAQHAALLVSILDEYNDGVGSSATMRYQAAMEAMDQLVRLELYEHLETCKIQTKYMRTAKIAQVHTLSQEETELFYSANIYQGLPKQILTNQSRGWESVNARSRANWPNISSV